LLTRIVAAVVWILRFLPLGLLAAIGSALGSLLYILGRERRKVCLTNLSRCLPEITEKERVALAKAHFAPSAAASSSARFCGGRHASA